MSIGIEQIVSRRYNHIQALTEMLDDASNCFLRQPNEENQDIVQNIIENMQNELIKMSKSCEEFYNFKLG